MARKSAPPSLRIKRGTDSWRRPMDTDGSAPSEQGTALRYSEMLDRFDGKVHTKKTADYSEAAPSKWPAGLEPSDHYGETCGECFVQRSRNGDCMC